MPFTLSSSLAAGAFAAAQQLIVQDPPAPVEEPPTPTVQAEAPTRSRLSDFNPQISLVSDFRSRFANSQEGGEKLSELKELELGLAADVDPFLRAEAYIAFAREDGENIVEVEEAFATYSRLGRGLTAKFGKIAGAVGRVQRNHADQQNWLDYPYAIQDILGEEGLKAPGASLSYLLPGDRFHEFTLEALVPDESPIFMGSDNGKPVVIGHYRTFFDFSEDLSAQLGATYAQGPNESTRSTLYGLDYTMKFQPGSGNAWTFEAEALWAKPGSGAETAFGMFAAGTVQLSKTLFGTVKWDQSEIPGTDSWRRGWTVGLTLRPTEFHHWRLQFQDMQTNFGESRRTLDLQFQWMIGAHPAHKY
ncbi:MAG: hypothetical protein JNK63_05795 [Chthonomonas sp.]|nr:hypothetical protein [Chthonomonas sp.]